MFTQLPAVWQTKCQALHWQQPTAIQTRSFTPLKEGRAVLGISPTGTGKTVAYLWPLLLRLQQGQGNQLLIVAPSQELAAQLAQVTKEWADLLALKSQLLIGGANVARQIEKLKKKPEILIGTPGRLLELAKKKKIKMHQLQSIVLDEADVLMQEQQWTLTQQLLARASKEVQLAFYSATAASLKEKIAAFVPNYVTIEVLPDQQTTGKVTHHFLSVPSRKKAETLRRLAHSSDFLAVVFFNQVSTLGSIAEKLRYENVPVLDLASDQHKFARKAAIAQFAEKKVPLLLTTEVAARGLDFVAVPYVVNVDVPPNKESYLHRAGRVGRMGASGAVITFVEETTHKKYRQLCQALDITATELFLYEGALHQESKEVRKKRIHEIKKR